MRPDIDYLLDTDFDYKCPNYAIDLMVDCWAELPEHRYKHYKFTTYNICLNSAALNIIQHVRKTEFFIILEYKINRF